MVFKKVFVLEWVKTSTTTGLKNKNIMLPIGKKSLLIITNKYNIWEDQRKNQ